MLWRCLRAFSRADALMATGFALACRVALVAALGLLGSGLVVAASQSLPVAVIAFGLLVWGGKRRRFGSGTAYGSARLASHMQLEANGLIGGGGLILGRAGWCMPPTWRQALFGLLNPFCRSESAVRQFLTALVPKSGEGRMIRLRTFTHLCTFAPAGKGKSVAVLVPNLRSYSGSCVIVDPKAELFKLTAWYRRWALGHRIVRIDPFKLTKKSPPSDTLNPLDFLNPGDPDFLDNCRDLANMLIVRQGTETDPHWNDAAELCLTAFIAYVRACEQEPEHRNLQSVRGLVSSPVRFAQAIADMQADSDPVIQRLGSQLEWFKERELNSVMTSLTRHVSWMDSPAVAANMRRSSFDPRWLKSRRTTVYLVLPHDKLTTLAPLMRMWLGTILRVVTKGQANESRKVLFLIDEAAHIGRVKALEDALTLMRGMGVRLWFFFQSLDQLKKCFGEHFQTALDNFDTQQFFGTNSFETADAISKKLGTPPSRSNRKPKTGEAPTLSEGVTPEAEAAPTIRVVTRSTDQKSPGVSSSPRRF